MLLESLITRYKADKSHSEQVKNLSLKIFDETKKIGLHDFSDEKRTMLEIGAELHDIGYFIEAKGHNKHSSALIKKEDFFGIDSKQKKIIACIARYHRGSLPQQKHATFGSLSAKKQKTVQRLAGMVRLADGLDRYHLSSVKDLALKYCSAHNILWIKVISEEADFKVDLDSAIRKKDLFEKAFGLQLVLLNT